MNRRHLPWAATRRWLWTSIARLRLRHAGAEVGPGLKVDGPLRLHVEPGAKIHIGANCRINSGYSNNPVGGGQQTSFWVMDGGVLIIGDRVGISSTTLVVSISVVIECDAMIGGGCSIYDTDFHSVLPEERLRRPDPGIRRRPVRIGERAFIGGHCIILAGVTVGRESVLGAGSVAPRSVPDAEVWAGNPATKRRDLRAKGGLMDKPT